ncbi:MAG: hypothetical protein M0P12_11350 [Paludibacteraceae bacterium]|nr:hypothetical protein [Paludibacteraceae bacterium]
MQMVEGYLKRFIGENVKIVSIRNKLSLPLYISEGFKFFTAEILGRKVLMTQPHKDDDFTPEQLRKINVILDDVVSEVVIFVFGAMPVYNRQRLMQRRLNFIVLDKVIYIPSLLLDVQPVAKMKPKKFEVLTPLAQLIVLYHLQKQSLDGYTTHSLAEKFNTTYITASRAFRSIKELGLIKEIAEKEKTLLFVYDGRQLWEKSLPAMTSPVVQTVSLDEEIIGEGVYISNINALAEYTMLNDESAQYYAMTEAVYQKNYKQEVSGYGDNRIEIFKYDPTYLANGGIIDPLSLYLELRDNKDDRIQIELEQLIKSFQWLKG